MGEINFLGHFKGKEILVKDCGGEILISLVHERFGDVFRGKCKL